MKKKTPPKDINVNAFEILEAVIQQTEEKPKKKKSDDEKNPAAVALGRLGGLKGGKARADSLTKEKRRDIALKAAKARWKHPS